MSDAVPSKYKQRILAGLTSGTVKAALINTDVYPSWNDAHEFYSDLSSAVIGTPVTLTGVTINMGVIDANDLTFNAVTGAKVGAIVLYLDTGSGATSPVFHWKDQIPGFPFVPTGLNLTVVWNNLGIVKL